MPRLPAGAHLKGGAAAAVSNARYAREFYAPILPIVLELHNKGLSLRQIARELDSRGVKTRQEWEHWSAQQVKRVLARALAEPTTARSGDRIPAVTEATGQQSDPGKALELLARCRALGFDLADKSGELLVTHPPEEPVPPDLWAEIVAHEQELLALLAHKAIA